MKKMKLNKLEKVKGRKNNLSKKEENIQNPKKKKGIGLDISIKMQLLFGFAVPILFVIFVGFFSYYEAEEGMITNYEVSAQNTIDAQMKYLDFCLSTIQGDVVQIKYDTELQSLVAGTYKNDNSKTTFIKNKINSTINVKMTVNNFINNVYVIPQKEQKVISSAKLSIGNLQPDGFFEEWSKTEEGKAINSKQITGWVSSHPEMDKFTGYNPEEYVLSYMTPFQNKKAVLVVDINREKIVETLQVFDVSQGAIVALVTADGKEIVVKEEDNLKEIIFSEQDFYKESILDENKFGSKYITYDGTEYLYIYRTSEESGVTLAYLVPSTKVTASAGQIKKMTVFSVILASVIAVLIGVGISLNITTSMSSIIKRLKKVAEGDLTVQMKIKGRSEFSTLNRHIANVIDNTRELIQKVERIVVVVSASAEEMKHVSGNMESSSKGIVEALEEIDAGVGQQAYDAQDCLTQMDSLSQSIEEITVNINETSQNSGTTKNIVMESIGTMETLSDQTKKSISVTSMVKDDVKVLEQKSSEIRKFVTIIADIAEQTNLLSLNASIEAARAGEAGRGFSVVAEEIRKLADGSHQAAEEINKLVATIEKQTCETVDNAMDAERIVEEQAETVNVTKDAFQHIYEATQQVIGSINDVKAKVRGMDKERIETLEAISSISAVAEETAAASSNVFSIAQSQKDIVVAMIKASDELKENTEELKQAISVFKTI